jgi:hypothetical protein
MFIKTETNDRLESSSKMTIVPVHSDFIIDFKIGGVAKFCTPGQG